MSEVQVPSSVEALTDVMERILNTVKASVEDVRIKSDDLGKCLDIIVVGEEQSELIRSWITSSIAGHRVFVYSVPPLTTQEEHIKQVVGTKT